MTLYEGEIKILTLKPEEIQRRLKVFIKKKKKANSERTKVTKVNII